MAISLSPPSPLSAINQDFEQHLLEQELGRYRYILCITKSKVHQDRKSTFQIQFYDIGTPTLYNFLKIKIS